MNSQQQQQQQQQKNCYQNLYDQKINTLEANQSVTEATQDQSQEFPSHFREDSTDPTTCEENHQSIKHNALSFQPLQQQQIQDPHLQEHISQGSMFSQQQYPLQQNSQDYTDQYFVSYESNNQIENQKNLEQSQTYQDAFEANNQYQPFITDSGNCPPQPLNQNIQNTINQQNQYYEEYPNQQQQIHQQVQYQYEYEQIDHQLQQFQQQQQLQQQSYFEQQQYGQQAQYQSQQYQPQQYQQQQQQQFYQEQQQYNDEQQQYYQSHKNFFQNLAPRQYQENQHFSQLEYNLIEQNIKNLNSDQNQQQINFLNDNSTYQYQKQQQNEIQQNFKTRRIQNEKKDKPHSDLKDKVRIRKQITMKKVANQQEKKPVKAKKAHQSTQFHNQFKIFLTKAIPYLNQKYVENQQLDEETKEQYKQIILPFKNKIKKEDVYFLINQYEELSEEQFEDLYTKFKESTQLMKDAKFDAKLRAFLQIQKFVLENQKKQELTFKFFTEATNFVNKLNSYNRSYLYAFCNFDYYPKIFSTKANKLDQLYVVNYLKFALQNPKIME